MDFFSLSYYQTNCVTVAPNAAQASGNLLGGAKNPYLESSQWGWQVDPDGLRYSLNEYYARYHLPLMVVENGLGASDTLEADGTVHDPYRIDYLKEHVKAMSDAINIDGVDLIGELKKQYDFVRSVDEINARKGKVICIDETMDDAAEQANLTLLADATKASIAKLQERGGKGFFMIVEGDKID